MELCANATVAEKQTPLYTPTLFKVRMTNVRARSYRYSSLQFYPFLAKKFLTRGRHIYRLKKSARLANGSQGENGRARAELDDAAIIPTARAVSCPR